MKRRDFVQRIAVSAGVLPFVPYNGLLMSDAHSSMALKGFDGHVRHGLFNAPVVSSNMSAIVGDWIFGLTRDTFYKDGFGARQGTVTRIAVITGGSNGKELSSVDIFSRELIVGIADKEHKLIRGEFSHKNYSAHGCQFEILTLNKGEELVLAGQNESCLLLLEGRASMGFEELSTGEALILSKSGSRIHSHWDNTLILRLTKS